MDLKLRVLEGKNAGQEISVPGRKFLIGRAEDCHLRPGSDLISRHHCVLLIEEGYIGVRDFGSKNGTYINDERVVGERELKPGDRLTIGPLRFEIHVAHGLAAKKRPPVGDIKEAVARTAHDAAKNPVDVTQWLASGEPAAEPKPAAAQETQAASLSDTDSIRLGTTQTLTPETMAQQEARTPAPHGKKPPGKLPRISDATKDSQEAAAAMLSKFRKRR
jgi:predicted component of type VI protein secretion system